MPNPANPPSIGDLHDEQIVALLRTGAHAALLSAYFGDIAYRELSQLARLAAIRRNDNGDPVLILPGVMGSRLEDSSASPASLIWLHPAAIGEGLLSQLALPGSQSMRASGVMLPGYLKLKLSLESAGFRPLFHPFDWRKDLLTLGDELLATVEKLKGPVSVVAHSMGGVVARAALRKDKSRRIAKLIQLGAPNRGSFAPVQALRAVYPTVRKIAALDFRHTAEELARDVFHTLAGLYHLLPDGDQDFFDVARWPRDQLAPNAQMLADARTARALLAPADDRCYLIAGVNQETVVAADLRDSQFEYTIRRDGDGTVPLALAQWRGAQTWYVEENHGGLTNNNSVLAAVDDLLRSGSTSRLTDRAPATDRDSGRRVTDAELRREAVTKVRWDTLSLDSRRRILDPVITPEFKKEVDSG
ncbi:pimeloyl-ACP methyl ester carboxylesterase [Povalibacter uvarum]|uniref:Pimeloyl-ACP methyl ester carboxylesterase n=1 Tax=Povalibacter uvarum TaxID=732238 RepID=A0A841HLM6_9GAMM|nr:alpha/beta fold hydrolase [Povalibacter uvarum]MBB6092885.1 pimeloyl-ACP methyl ester carboxylesterase [Povalibacter uvarum]